MEHLHGNTCLPTAADVDMYLNPWTNYRDRCRCICTLIQYSKYTLLTSTHLLVQVGCSNLFFGTTSLVEKESGSLHIVIPPPYQSINTHYILPLYDHSTSALSVDTLRNLQYLQTPRYDCSSIIYLLTYNVSACTRLYATHQSGKQRRMTCPLAPTQIKQLSVWDNCVLRSHLTTILAFDLPVQYQALGQSTQY